MPTYNRADLLAETLAHLEKVCGDDVEVVVSDNHSPDHTQAVIERFAPRFRHFRAVRQPVNRGPFPNHAAAIQLGTGEYIYTLNDDDELYMEGLRAAMAVLDSDPQIVAVYGAYEEWSRTKGALSGPLRSVNQRVNFAKGDKLGVFNAFTLLWFPVCRRDAFQRFFTYDDKSFGFWELVGSLLERGGISIIPDMFYRHSHTEPRLEYELTESWYHDEHRAQHEAFLGRIGSLDARAVAEVVNNRVAPAYLQGVRFATVKREFLTARHFFLRARAYGLVTEPDMAAWERQSLVGMVAERLLYHVGLNPGMRRVLFEDLPKLAALRAQFAEIAPAYTVGQISQAEWQAGGLPEDGYLVTHIFSAPGWEKTVDLGPARCRAAMDMAESCRITNQPLGF